MTRNMTRNVSMLVLTIVATIAATIGIPGVGPVPAAAARDYTPDLSAFYNACAAGGDCTAGVNSSAFRDYVTQIGEMMAPQFMGPAGTLGSNGFELTYGAGFGTVDSGSDAWSGYAGTQPGVARNPGSTYYSNQFHFKKGLPASFQIGGSVTHLFESDLWGIGLDVSWSFLDGYKKIPDMGIFLSVGTLLGAPDLLMLQVNAAFIISKSFNVAGYFSFEPWLGYNMMFVTAGTHLTNMWAADGYGGQFALDPEYILRHRVEAGLNAVVENFVAGGGMVVDVQTGRITGAVKVGVRFW